METVVEVPSFDELTLNKKLVDAIKEVGYTQPTAIQHEVIPYIVAGNDVVAKAQTGSGKTAAFCLPALHLLAESNENTILVLTPTRELAMQICDEMRKFSKHMGISPTAIYGGEPLSNQLKRLKQDRRILIATPGRLLDLYRSNHLTDFSPLLVVLDEADEMLNMGFMEDVQAIFEFLPEERQTLMFSATISSEIKKLSKNFLNQPIYFDQSSSEQPHADIEQICYLVPEKEKAAALVQIFQFYSPEKSIVFCNTKRQVDELATKLGEHGFSTLSLHGDMSQKERQFSIGCFRKAPRKILVATDVAGRGINVTDVSYVFNYDLPYSPACYTHRIGRTGRMGNKGTAITLITQKQKFVVKKFLPNKGNSPTFINLPSAEEIQGKQKTLLVESLENEIAHEEAAKTLSLLQEKLSMEEIALRLISRYWCKEQMVSSENLVVSPTGDSEKRGDFERGDRGDRGGKFKPRSGGGRFEKRDRPPYGKGRSDFAPRGEGRGDFAPRGDRPFYPKERESFGPPRERGEFSSAPRGDRPFYPKERESFGPPRERGGFSSAPRGDRPFYPKTKESFGPPRERGDRDRAPSGKGKSFGPKPFSDFSAPFRKRKRDDE